MASLLREILPVGGLGLVLSEHFCYVFIFFRPAVCIVVLGPPVHSIFRIGAKICQGTTCVMLNVYPKELSLGVGWRLGGGGMKGDPDPSRPCVVYYEWKGN